MTAVMSGGGGWSNFWLRETNPLRKSWETVFGSGLGTDVRYVNCSSRCLCGRLLPYSSSMFFGSIVTPFPDRSVTVQTRFQYHGYFQAHYSTQAPVFRGAFRIYSIKAGSLDIAHVGIGVWSNGSVCEARVTCPQYRWEHIAPSTLPKQVVWVGHALTLCSLVRMLFVCSKTKKVLWQPDFHYRNNCISLP